MKFGLLDGFLSTDKFGDIIEDWLVKLEVFFFDLPDGLLHFVLYFSDLSVSFVDGNSLDFLRKWKLFDAFLDILKGNLSLTLK